MDDPNRQKPDDIEYSYTVAPTEAIRIMLQSWLSNTISASKLLKVSLRSWLVVTLAGAIDWACYLRDAAYCILSTIISPLSLCYNLLFALAYSSSANRFESTTDMKDRCRDTSNKHGNKAVTDAFRSLILIACCASVFIIASQPPGNFEGCIQADEPTTDIWLCDKNDVRDAGWYTTEGLENLKAPEPEPPVVIGCFDGCTADGAAPEIFFCNKSSIIATGWYKAYEVEYLCEQAKDKAE